LSSDHSSVIFTINSKIKVLKVNSLQRQNRTALFPELLRTTLDYSILLKTDNDITYTVEGFNHAAQQATWSAMPISNNLEINIEYSMVIKEKLVEESKLASMQAC